MNRLFKITTWKDKAWAQFASNQYLSATGSQATIYKDLVR